MKKIVLSVIIVMTVSFASSAQTNKRATCSSEHSKIITLSELQSKWPHYKFKTLDDALNDLKQELKKYGVVRVNLKGRQESNNGPNFSESYQYSIDMFDSRGKKVDVTERLFSIQVCLSDNPWDDIDWRFGWK